MKLRRQPPFWAAALGILLLAGCDAAPEAPTLPPTRGYILISIDTLRADHLGCYGYERATSPFIDSLAERGTLFENAVVQLPGTLPSHMSIFTGLYPAEHGVYPPNGVLPATVETLPEVFQRHGFATAGFTEGGYTDGSYGFARGFDRWNDQTAGSPRDVETTVGRGLEFLSELPADQRFFLFLHTYAVHDPYDPPEPHRGLFWDREPPAAFAPTGPNLSAVNRGTLHLTPEALEYFVALYDAGIHYTDEVLGGFFDGLQELGLADEVTVVVTADHGEEFMEHGSLAHEQIYDPTLRVPLIVLHPDQRSPQRISSLVQSIDLAPTLYQLAAIEPAKPGSGASLVPLLRSGDPAAGDPAAGDPGPREEAYAESHDGGARALYRRTAEGELYHLLRFDPRAEEGGLWVSREVAFDVAGGELDFEAKAYHRPRTVTVEIDGESVASLEIGTAWDRHRLALPTPERKKTVTLVPATCDSPESLGLSADRRCLAFRIRGTSLERLELYDLGSDHGESRDLSAERLDLTRDLRRRLAAYAWTPVAAEQGELDPELEKRLRALGYLD